MAHERLDPVDGIDASRPFLLMATVGSLPAKRESCSWCGVSPVLALTTTPLPPTQVKSSVPWPIALTGCKLASPVPGETAYPYLQGANNAPQEVTVNVGEEVSDVRQILLPPTSTEEAALGSFIASWRRATRLGEEEYTTEYSLPTLSLRPPGLVVTRTVDP